MAISHNPEAAATLERTKLLIIRALLLAQIAISRPGDAEALLDAQNARAVGTMFDIGYLVVAQASSHPKETLLQHVRDGIETHVQVPPVSVVFRHFSFSSRLPTKGQEPGVYVYPYRTVPGHELEAQQLPRPNCPPDELKYVRMLFSRVVVAGWQLADEEQIRADLAQRYVSQPGMREQYATRSAYLDLGKYISETTAEDPGQE